jgi:uncharacterized membrane protein YgcG
MIAVLVAVVAMGLSVVGVAWGSSAARTHTRRAGACRTLMSNPQAVKEMRALRAEHQKDMQAWFSQYGSDPNSAAAKAALQQLRQSHWGDMKTLCDKYGVKVPSGSGSGSGSGVGAGACGGSGGMRGGGGSCGGGGSGGLGGGSGSTRRTGFGQGMMGSGGGMMGGLSY